MQIVAMKARSAPPVRAAIDLLEAGANKRRIAGVFTESKACDKGPFESRHVSRKTEGYESNPCRNIY
jgi:hypothetical protein